MIDTARSRIPVRGVARLSGHLRFPHLHQQDGTVNQVRAFCESFRFKQISHGYGASGQTTPRFKNGTWRPLALQPHLNERARHDSHAAPRIKPSPCGPHGGTGTIPGPPRRSFITRVLLPRKACLSAYDATFSCPCTYIADNHSESVKYVGRASRAVLAGDVGLSAFPDKNPM
jgi:hypothetical protein